MQRKSKGILHTFTIIFTIKHIRQIPAFIFEKPVAYGFGQLCGAAGTRKGGRVKETIRPVLSLYKNCVFCA